MANYFLVILDQAGHQWLLGLPEDSFDSWEELRQAFIDNFIATCEQPGNKYDLERIRDWKNEPLRDYIRRFSDMRLKISKISHNDAISAFIKGLCFHEALRSKLLRKRPTTVAELLAMAKNYADADDAEKLIREDVRGAEQPPRRDDSRGRFDTRNPHRGDNRDHREGWDRHGDNRDDFRCKRPRDNDHEVNTIKCPNGRRDYQEDYNKTLKGTCQLHPKSNHTKNVVSSKASTHSGPLRGMPPRKMGNRTDAVRKTMTTTRIGTHDTNMSVPPTWYTPSLEAKSPSSQNEKESS